MGRSSSSYGNSEFYRAARTLREGAITVDEIIENLSEWMAWSFTDDDEKQYFDYDYFRQYIQKNLKNGGFYHWNGLKYFLYEYEMEKVRKRGSQKIDWDLFVKGEKDRVSIEHIFPQTPNLSCWKDSFKGVKKNHLELLKGTLGNLVPLSQSINSSIQNDCFDDKKKAKFNEKNEKIRQGYSDGSHSEIEVSGYSDWNADSIMDRGFKLLDFMAARWELQFENDDAKRELLFLDFMTNEDENI